MVVAATFVVVVGFAVQPVAAHAVAARTPNSAADCKGGGWRTLVDGQGRPFASQGACISWQIHHPHVFAVGDLAGSFSGTSVFNFSAAGCSFVHQVLDAVYPGSSAVGDVTLHIDACVDLPSGLVFDFPMTGTFTISTSVGTLTGSASGTQTVLMDPVPISLRLTPTVGTGVFSTPSGALQLNGLWTSTGSEGTPEPVTGTVVVA
jgi:hypothetical protein